MRFTTTLTKSGFQVLSCNSAVPSNQNYIGYERFKNFEANARTLYLFYYPDYPDLSQNKDKHFSFFKLRLFEEKSTRKYFEIVFSLIL